MAEAGNLQRSSRRCSTTSSTFDPGSARGLGELGPGRAARGDETENDAAPPRYRQCYRCGSEADRIPREHTASRSSGLAVAEVLEISARGGALMLVLGTRDLTDP